MEISDIRTRARASLNRDLFCNTWLGLIVVELVAAVIVGVPNSISAALARISPAMGASLGAIISIASILVAGPIAYGVARVYLNVARGNKKVDLSELFCGFKEAFVESVVLSLLRGIFVFLWSLLFVIPGIVKSYAYSMSSYIQQESEDKTWRTCLDKSIEMMDGYKVKLFLLDLSFIGWYILGALCLGIGLLWVSVYHSEARAHFYEELKRIRAEEDAELSADPASEEPVFTESENESEDNE